MKTGNKLNMILRGLVLLPLGALAALLLLVAVGAAIACAAPTATPPPPATATAAPTLTPTPRPTATPEPTPDYQATTEAGVAATIAAIPPTATPEPTPTPTPAPTATPYPTYTPYPTATLYPTSTPYPTNTPYPTYTPYPTATPHPTTRPTATPRPTPASWITYQYSEEFRVPRGLDIGVDFSITVPPHWKLLSADVYGLSFSTRNQEVLLEILPDVAPLYDNNRSIALDEFAEDYREWASEDELGFETSFSADSVKRVQLGGAAIYWMEGELVNEPAWLYCSTKAWQLIALPPSWPVPKEFLLLLLQVCEPSLQDYSSEVQQVLDSFRYWAR